MKLTVAQALIRFLANQYSERDGVEQRLIAGTFGIFGHGNVAGVGQALLESQEDMPYVLARNEQAMVHSAAGYARQKNRLSTYACASSIGPGATNMVTGAALATINRLPVLLLPGDIFSTRAASPVLQELEDPGSLDVSVNDTFKPVSRFWDRINRPEQLASSLLAAMRVLTDPADTGAVCLALPQDVQAEAHDWPEELFERRVWHVRRQPVEPGALQEAAELLRGARRPLIVSGGGTIYAEATDALREFAEGAGIPVGETQAGKGSLPYDHPQSLGAIGATGTTAANAIAREADVIVGIGTRWSDFTTASRSLFAEDARFVNLNVAPVDAFKHAGLPLVGDARAGLEGLREALNGHAAEPDHTERATRLAAEWDATVEQAYTLGHGPLPAQSEVLGVVNRVSGPRDVVVCAAGSMPGDLHKLWRTRDPKGYHVEYGYSCMGYEIAGGLGVKLAAPDRDVYVMVGDGSFLMMAQEIVTAVQEGVDLRIVLVQNRGFASIGALSESVGSQRFGTAYRTQEDLARVAEGLGATVHRAATLDELEAGLRAAQGVTVVEIQTDPRVGAPDSEAWWDVPVAEVSGLDSTRAARETYDENKQTQQPYLNPRERVTP
jgi:3D-(3,5/4)-trihydroxycyclohexane-1,2-dione acylhydrolase (decyclizing)